MPPPDGVRDYSLDMRASRTALVIAIVGLLLTVVGCSKQITGTALPDPAKVPLAIAGDGYGIVAGFGEAPVKIENYSEPQCTHCSELQRDFGDQMAYYLNIGRLQITYRPLTFLDDDYAGYSSRVANALFLAAEAIGNASATGTQFQLFVEDLWINQDPGGPGFTDDELRDMALASGMPDLVADNIASDQEAVDLADMEETNFGYLFEIDEMTTGTPTVFDLDTNEKLDIFDANWLEDLVES